MNDQKIPINKGNYSLDTPEREVSFEAFRGSGWEKEYKEYRKNWTDFAINQRVSNYPLLVDLELASVCNLKCPMCYTISPEFKKKVNAKLMDFDLYKRVIDEIAGHVPAVRLSLRGESLLHKRFVECVQYAKDKGVPEVSTLTHGAKLTGRFIEEIITAGIDWITVSIDGIDDTYEKIRKPIKFTEILSNIKEIHEYKRQHGLHRPVIKVQGIWPAIREDAQAYYDTFAPYTDLVAFNPLIDYRFRDKDIIYVDSFSCPQQYQRLVIGADGLVMKCSNDEDNQEVIGDITKQTVNGIWHGKEMQEIREIMKKPNGFMDSKVCRQCYLPRKTINNERTNIHGRQIIIENYVNRSQEIGE